MPNLLVSITFQKGSRFVYGLEVVGVTKVLSLVPFSPLGVFLVSPPSTLTLALILFPFIIYKK